VAPKRPTSCRSTRGARLPLAALAGLVVGSGGLVVTCQLIAPYASATGDATATSMDASSRDLAVGTDAPLSQRDAHTLTDSSLDVTDGTVVTHVTVDALRAAFEAAEMLCIHADGSTDGTTVPIIDTSLMAFFPAAESVLIGAPASLSDWVGDGPAALIVYDPNACETIEDPVVGDTNWESAGLLIRGATIEGTSLVLPGDLTSADIDLLDVAADGSYQAEFAGVDDAQLADYPHIEVTANAAKAILLDFSGGR